MLPNTSKKRSRQTLLKFHSSKPTDAEVTAKRARLSRDSSSTEKQPSEGKYQDSDGDISMIPSHSPTNGSTNGFRMGISSRSNGKMKVKLGGSKGGLSKMGSSKKLKIKPFKVKPKLPASFFTDTFAKLYNAIDAVHNAQPVPQSLEELYRATEDLCMHKKAEELYEQLKKRCDVHIEKSIGALVEEISLNRNAFLEAVQRVWLSHCDQMLTIRGIFLYLDRSYVIQTNDCRSLWDLGLRLFCTHFQKHEEIERRVVRSLLSLIESERRGEIIDRSLVKTLIRMLLSLDIYTSSFEKDLFDATKEFYNEEGHRLIHRLSTADYLTHVSKRLGQEGERVSLYLDSRTKKELVAILLDCLVRERVPTIIKKGFELLVSGDKIDDLQRMYSLFASVNHLPQLQDAFETYIKNEGSKVVLDESRDKTMVVDLLTFKSKLDAMLSGPFQNNSDFRYALKRSFEYFINRRANRPAELIAKYVDQKLKQGNKNASEEELEEDLDRAMVLFRFINGKDVFEAFYKKDLAKRFLLNKSASEDAERLMIAKLKAECGTGFTQKLEGMLQDIELSKEIMAKYNKYRKEKFESTGSQTSDAMDTSEDGPSSSSSSSSSSLTPAPSSAASQLAFDMGCHVLTTSSWPEYKAMHVKLPEEIEKEQDTFAKYYLNQHTGRKLMWMTPLTHCILGAKFKSGRKELAVSAFQAVVLMLFNNKDILSYKEIRSKSELEDEELKRTLQSLLSGKTREMRVLIKKPNVRVIDENDQFKVNPHFKSKFYRVKVNSIQIKETVAENKRTNEQIHQDRMYQIDACIVRIMKSRKSLKHQLLIAAVFEQLKFPAQTVDLKKRIESLLQRDYIERDEDDPQSYNYLA